MFEVVVYMDFLDRLKEYMNTNNLRQIDLVNECNVTKSFISGILSDTRKPNVEFLTALSKFSGKSINWWLFGEEEYKGLASLNVLIDTFIKSGEIKEDGTYDKDIGSILITMLNKEIRVKLEQKKSNNN